MQIDPTIGGTTPAQIALAAGLVGVALVIIVILATTQRTAGLTERQKGVKVAIENGLARQAPGTVRIPERSAIGSKREAIRAAFHHSGVVDDATTARDAGRELVGHAWELVQPYADRLPKGARRYGGLAILIFAFGAVAFGAEAIAAALQGDGLQLQVAQWPALILQESAAVLSLAHSLIGEVPVVGTLASLAWAFAIIAAEWVYSSWFLFAVVLGSVAIKIWYADRQGAGQPSFSLPHPAIAGKPIALGAAGLWAMILAILAIGRLVGPNDTARQVAALAVFAAAALAVLAIPVLVGVRGLGAVRALRSAYGSAADDRERGRLIVWLVGLLAAVIAAPVVPIWGVVALTKVPVLAKAWLAAGQVIQAGTAVIAVLLVVLVAVALRDVLPEVRTGLQESVSRRGWQAAVFGRAAPLGVVAVAFFVALSVAGPIGSVVIALLAGLLTMLLWQGYVRVRAYVDGRDDRERKARAVVVHAYTIQTPAGERYLARVNGSLVAAESIDGAVGAVCERAGQCFDDGQTDPSVAAAFGRELRDNGIADREEVRRQLRADCRREIEGRVHKSAGLPRDELGSQLETRFPEDIWQAELDKAISRKRAPVEQLGTRIVPT